MARKLIPPRRDEVFSNDGLGTVRMLEYLEENAKQTNDSTDATEGDPSSVNLSSAQLSQVNKKVAELVNESLTSQAGIIAKLAKEIEQLKSTITSNANSNLSKRIAEIESSITGGNDSNNSKKIKELENDFTAPFYKTIYNKLTIKLAITKDLTTDNATVNALLSAPTGSWSTGGINLIPTKDYRINNLVVLNNTTLGAGVTASSLTTVGTLTSANTSGVYSVDGTQVVSNRGAAVTDSDGTLASATSQLNALLARVRVHGLIA